MRRSDFLLLATIILFVAACLRVIGLTMYPPGPHYDEAVNLLVVRSIVYGGARFFPMLEAYQGREVLYFYLNAPMVAFVSNSMFSFHLTNVFSNLITIAAAMGLGRAIFPGRRGLLIGAVAGVLMTFSFHQVWLGRQAFRAVTLPMMQALALLFLFRGMRARRGWGWLILAGFFAGGALYTYNSSRLFPIWLGIGVLVMVIAARFERQSLLNAVVFGIAMTLTAAPMIAYAFQRPDVFFGRLGEVTQAGQSVTLAESIFLHLKMFFIQGDPYVRYNDPGRPYFTWIEGVFLLLGIGIALIRVFRHGMKPVLRMGYALVLLSPLMVIPSVISVGGLPPSNMRSLGMVPLIFLLVAVGVEAAYGWAYERLNNRNRQGMDGNGRDISRPYGVSGIGTAYMPSVRIFLLAVLAIGSIGMGTIYFRWVMRADVFFETDADLSLAAKWAVENRLPGEQLYVAARDKGHPTVMIEPLTDITWIGTDTLFLPNDRTGGLYIFPASALPAPEFVRILRDYGSPISGLPLGPTGHAPFHAYRSRGVAPMNLSQIVGTLPVHNPYLYVSTMPSWGRVTAGQGGWLLTNWVIIAPPDVPDLTPLVQIEDENGTVYARGEAYMTETNLWRPGEILIQRINVDIPSFTPNGSYRMKVAWVARSADRYISYFNDDGTQAGIWADVGRVFVDSQPNYPAPSEVAIQNRIDQPVGAGVQLLGYDGTLDEVRPGDALPLTLYWNKMEAGGEPLTLTAALRNDDGVEVILWEGHPIRDEYLSSEWSVGEILGDRVRWHVPVETPAGNYTLLLTTSEGEISLGELSVADVPRLFGPPPFEQELEAVFGGQISLAGYTLERGADIWNLELVWRAEQEIPRDYKVFVHLVDADGTILAQHDAIPVDNTYATTLWLAGEYVRELIQLPISSADSALRIGLYDPETGSRLQLNDFTDTQTEFIEVDLNITY